MSKLAAIALASILLVGSAFAQEPTNYVGKSIPVPTICVEAGAEALLEAAPGPDAGQGTFFYLQVYGLCGAQDTVSAVVTGTYGVVKDGQGDMLYILQIGPDRYTLLWEYAAKTQSL